ncbi:hypothetical protein GpartN1_g42.t1 [Galdieria partita]|uniref:RNA-binding protein n=1 Tax=Galdieria partita TaxID=83374 RepID=A0A9C7PQY6_9RHOD|nr:hypothetical protein GpartN1_g42.t1 [Galdieria partita]
MEGTEQTKVGASTTFTSPFQAKSLGEYHGESSEDRRDRTASSTSVHHVEEVVPSNTIIVREIPNPVDSKSLKQFFTNSFGPVRDIRIPHTQFSTRSKSYGFVEFVRVETAQKVVDKAASGNLVYQGSQLEVTFASDGFEKKGWDCLSCGYANFARRRVCKQCGAKKEINDILGSPQSKFIAGDVVLAAQWTASSQGLIDQSPFGRYCLDPRSGWYYDPQTLYYVVDPINLVFYDGSRQVYLQYNSAMGTYIEYATTTENPLNQNTGYIVSNDNQSTEIELESVEQQTESITSSGMSTKPDANTSCEQESTKVASQDERQLKEPRKSPITVTPMKPRGRILSNIQRWNQRRVERQQILEEFEEEEDDGNLKKDESLGSDDGNHSVAYQRESDKPIEQDEEKEDDSVEKVSNVGKKTSDDDREPVFICDLCRRKFKSNDILEKHIQFSELHRTNLQKQNSIYRDRAAERRQLHPPEDVDNSHSKKSAHSKKRPFSSKKLPNQSLDIVNNIGAKLMKSMGWKEGQGLGREGSGITAPISAVANRGQSGLGSEPLNDPEVRIEPTDSQKERVRKETMLRWKMKFGSVSESNNP